ncbi:MAG: hypothetical protein R3E66_24350 [bacterium]
MASEQPTDKILDLLYGELSGDEESAARASVAEDPQKAAELEAFEQLRAQINENLTPVVPSMSVREALLAEAARSATRRADEPRSARRAPSDGVESQSFWKRISRGTGPQIALVAAVLLSAAYITNLGDSPSMQDQALYEPAPTVTLSKMSNEPAPALEEQAEPTPDSAPESEAAPVVATAEGMADGDERARRLDDAVAQRATTGETRSENVVREKAKAVAPAKGAKPMMKTAMPKAESMGSALGTADDFGVAKDARNAPAPVQAAPRDQLERSDKKADFAQEAPAAPQGEAKEAKLAAAAPGSLDAVEDAYSARDWRQVVMASDAVLEGSGTAVQKARALELKALAYQQMGMLQQALNVYRSIESNYSGYQPDRIRNARTEMERRLDGKPAPSTKSRKASSYDFEDEAVSPTSQ